MIPTAAGHDTHSRYTSQACQKPDSNSRSLASSVLICHRETGSTGGSAKVGGTKAIMPPAGHCSSSDRTCVSQGGIRPDVLAAGVQEAKQLRSVLALASARSRTLAAGSRQEESSVGASARNLRVVPK
jgi:hypothetical protein